LTADQDLSHNGALTVAIEGSGNGFSVQFGAVDDANSQGSRYAYRLEGYHDDWVYPPAGQRTAAFANLAPGRYTFLVKAGQGEGQWSEEVRSLRVEVRAPWWKTGWACLLYGAIGLAGVAVYRRVASLHNELGIIREQTRKLLTQVNELQAFRNAESGSVPLPATCPDAMEPDSHVEQHLSISRQHPLPGNQPEPAPAAPLAPEAAPEPEEARAACEAFAASGASSARPPRVLLVEDNDEVRQYLQQLFAADYEVFTAEDGLAGWDAALRQLPDLILSDVMMPRSDGLELCQRLKQHPKTAHIPVLLTARTAETHEPEGLGMGADEYVSKPFNPALLQAKAAALLRNRRKLHEFYQRQILLEPPDIVVADADREFLARAMAVVEQHLDHADFNVQVLVREMAMSQSVFYRRIKSISGQTAVEFIRDVRLKRAAQLLAQTPMRVSEVAMEVGIEDSKYFRKAFQKIYNVSPSEYAKQHR
jgi:DNA-binding response OmpR family regulator